MNDAAKKVIVTPDYSPESRVDRIFVMETVSFGVCWLAVGRQADRPLSPRRAFCQLGE